jgi:hypothetical protein
MFQALFAHHQEALRIQQVVYFVHIMLAGCYQGWSGTCELVSPVPLQTIVVYAVPPDDDQIVHLVGPNTLLMKTCCRHKYLTQCGKNINPRILVSEYDLCSTTTDI